MKGGRIEEDSSCDFRTILFSGDGSVRVMFGVELDDLKLFLLGKWRITSRFHWKKGGVHIFSKQFYIDEVRKLAYSPVSAHVLGVALFLNALYVLGLQ